MTRHEARQEAFCLLFEKTFSDLPVETIVENATETRDLQVDQFTLQLAKGVEEHIEEIDGIIQPKLKKWKLSRISKVSLSVLRMAVYEMLYLADVPVSVTINEAVELTKIYSGEEDSSFVNGVLGAAAKEHCPEKEAASDQASKKPHGHKPKQEKQGE